MFGQGSPQAVEEEMDEKLKEYLVGELGRSFLTVPFDIWLYICNKTREKIRGRFPNIELEPMTEEDARLWYTRYCFHCDDNCLSFLKSVVTGYPNFKWPEEVEQLIKLRCLREDIIAKKVKQEQREYSPKNKRKRYNNNKSGDFNPDDLYDPTAPGSSSDDDDKRESFVVPKKKRISPDVSLGHNPEPPRDTNIQSNGFSSHSPSISNNGTDFRQGQFSKSTVVTTLEPGNINGVDNVSRNVCPTSAKDLSTPEKLNFRNQKLDSIVITIPNVTAVPINNPENGIPVVNNFETPVPSVDSAVKDISNLPFLDFSQPPPGFVPQTLKSRKQALIKADNGMASVNVTPPPVNSRLPSSVNETLQCPVISPSFNSALESVNTTVPPLFSPRQEKPGPHITPHFSPKSPFRSPAFSPSIESPGVNGLVQYSGHSSSSSNISLGSCSSRKDGTTMKEQINWTTPRLILELPPEEIESRHALHTKNPPQDFPVSIIRDEDQSDPRMCAVTSFHLQRCLDIKKKLASKTLIEFERRDSVDTDTMEEISSISTVSSEDKSRQEGKLETNESRHCRDDQELCFAKNYLDLDIDMNAVEEESSSEGDDLDPVDFDKTYVRRRKDEPECSLIRISNSIFEEQRTSDNSTPEPYISHAQIPKKNPNGRSSLQSTNFQNSNFEQSDLQKQIIQEQKTAQPVINISKVPPIGRNTQDLAHTLSENVSRKNGTSTVSPESSKPGESSRNKSDATLKHVPPPAYSTSSVVTVRLSDSERIPTHKIPLVGGLNPLPPGSVRPTFNHFNWRGQVQAPQTFRPDGNYNNYRPRGPYRAPMPPNQGQGPGAFYYRNTRPQKFRRP